MFSEFLSLKEKVNCFFNYRPWRGRRNERRSMNSEQRGRQHLFSSRRILKILWNINVYGRVELFCPLSRPPVVFYSLTPYISSHTNTYIFFWFIAIKTESRCARLVKSVERGNLASLPLHSHTSMCTHTNVLKRPPVNASLMCTRRESLQRNLS